MPESSGFPDGAASTGPGEVKEVELRKNHFFLWLVIALFGGVIGGMVSNWFLHPGPEQSKDLREIVVAHEIHLVDDEGRDRWVLNLSREGEPHVTFVNRNGWAPMAMGINGQGLPFLNMVLEPNQKAGPSLIMMDSHMNSRALLGLNRDGEPYLTFLDQTGQNRVAVGSIEVVNPLTRLHEKRPCSSVILFDEKGEVLWSAPDMKFLPVNLSFADMGFEP
jgi:hypothetical protein